MATITQLSSASSGNASLIVLTGINTQPNDCLIVASAQYGLPDVNLLLSNGESIGLKASNQNTSPSPDLWGAVYDNSGLANTLSGGTLTWTQSGTSEAAVIVWRVRPDVGKVIVRQTIITTQSTGTSATITTSPARPVVPDSIVLGAGAVADDTYFTDSDTLNGSWSSVFRIANTSGDDVGVFSQIKQTSGGTGSQTYNGTWATTSSESSCLFAIVYYEVELPYWGIGVQ